MEFVPEIEGDGETPPLCRVQFLEQQVHQALQVFDESLVRDYRVAVQHARGLVLKETPVVDFLRTEQWNPIQAATRLAMHWKTRRQIFSEERWLLPMSQTSTGCLDADSVEILRSGYLTIVSGASPEHPKVWILDYSLLPQGAKMYHPKILFYMATVTSDRAFQTKGATVLFVVRSQERPPPILASAQVKQLMESVAGRIGKIFIGQAYEFGKEYLMDYLGYQQRRMVECNTHLTAQQVAADSLEGTLAQLQAQGFHQSSLPKCLGGDLDHTWFQHWIRSRLSIEDIMGATPPRWVAVSSISTDRQGEQEQASQQHQIVRRANRGQECIAPGEVSVLLVQNLCLANARLRKNNEKLEQILSQAQRFIMEMEESEDVINHS